ncbi:MAG: EAL domain-containing protein [Comamonadaceae bacterium]
MKLRLILSGVAARMLALRRDYRAVQDEAAMESMRRILITFWFFAPLELGLALWYANFELPARQPQAQAWANSLFLLHAITAATTLLLIALVHRILHRSHPGTRTVIAVQVLMCLTYLMYGVVVSYFDVAVGGTEAFILVCFAVAGLSLMRPLVSMTLFSVTFAAVWQMLLLTDQSGQQLAIMRLNSIAAIVLAVIVSAIIFHQYAKSLLLHRELEVLAGQDPLTLLPNRRELMERLKMALSLSARSGKCGALLLIDLDHFKNINDTRGHIVGDALLKEVAERLIASVREGDTVARFGGDEFMVMLENLGDDLNAAARQAEVVSEKILEKVRQHYILGPSEVGHSTASIGVALFSPGGHSTEELIKQADVAMYQAKDAGRNAARFYDAEMQARLVDRAAMEEDLRLALALGQFVLHYQSQVDSAGQVQGAEVLLRWLHPQRGLIAPGLFIPLAEEAGLIAPIGSWVLETTCLQLASWAMQPTLSGLTLSVNVSSHQFHQPDFVERVTQILVQTGADPKRLRLELTESIMVRDVDDVVAKMSALRGQGVAFSLDDFGTGYSSLAYLKRMPIDQLKIDQGFVRDILTDHNDAAIAKMVIVLAESMGLSVIAEGVETQQQRDCLAALGCHEYQGYLFGRPVPVKDFEAVLLRAAA